VVRILELDHAAQLGAVEHGNHVRGVRDLHRGRTGVAVDGDDVHAQTLRLDRDLLAQLARATEQELGGGTRARSAQDDGGRWHGAPATQPRHTYRVSAA